MFSEALYLHKSLVGSSRPLINMMNHSACSDSAGSICTPILYLDACVLDGWERDIRHFSFLLSTEQTAQCTIKYQLQLFRAEISRLPCHQIVSAGSLISSVFFLSVLFCSVAVAPAAAVVLGSIAADPHRLFPPAACRAASFCA